jgi:branched-chain amino acid transport system substrate-binding protein
LTSCANAVLAVSASAPAGWVYSPNAIASAPVVSAGKKLAVIMNAGTAHITQMSPYYVRTSFSMWHSGYSLGEAAAKQLKAKTAVVGYTDFPPGKDSLNAFKRAFEASGGKVVDEIPMGGAGAVPDMTPFFQRAKDKKPDVFFVFVPAGDHATAVVKTYGALGMRAAGIKLIGPGDITQDTKLQDMGPAAVGLITMHHYNADLDNPENKRFVAAWKKEYGADSTPDFMAVGGYDGMAAIVHAVQATKGKMDGEEAVKSLLGWKFDSPQGPITIDPATRDIVMNEYLDEVVKGSDGKLHQKVIGQIDQVKDQCKELAVGPCAPKK